MLSFDESSWLFRFDKAQCLRNSISLVSHHREPQIESKFDFSSRLNSVHTMNHYRYLGYLSAKLRSKKIAVLTSQKSDITAMPNDC